MGEKFRGVYFFHPVLGVCRRNKNAHTFIGKSFTLEHSEKCFSSLTLQLWKASCSDGGIKCAREKTFFPVHVFCFFSLLQRYLFSADNSDLFKNKVPHLHKREAHWKNDNGSFEKHWTYAWIEIMWVNKIWVLSQFFIKMALSSPYSLKKEKKTVFLFCWVSLLWFLEEK